MRSKTVDYLKCIAALLVINKHISDLYPASISFLSFGGYFANSIFFFVSGYCLTRVDTPFPKWYWKRFTRVYLPYLLFLPLMFFAGMLKHWDWVNIIMPYVFYHFIPTILYMYIIYFILTKLHQKTRFGYIWQIAAALAVTLVYFLLFFDKKNGNVIKHFTLIETTFYLIPMLLGGLAKEGKWIKSKSLNISVAVITFTVYLYQSFVPFTGYFMILKPAIGMIFSYALACLLLSAEEKLPQIQIVSFISKLTLDIYIVQFISIKAFKWIPFPTNIVYHVICTIGVAYCLHWVTERVLKRITPAK